LAELDGKGSFFISKEFYQGISAGGASRFSFRVDEPVDDLTNNKSQSTRSSEMAGAKQGDTVKVHYTGKLDDGTVFDSSAGREPLEFTLGAGQVIPGFEEAVDGMNPGESKTKMIPAEQAYGERRVEMVLQVERTHLPPGMDPQIGQEMQVRTADGAVVPVMVIDADEATITLDANHPLAGQNLTFEIELVSIDAETGNGNGNGSTKGSGLVDASGRPL
jgi:peptidylprolyl isomerase